MTKKTLLTFALLVYVCVSTAYIFVKDQRADSTAETQTPDRGGSDQDDPNAVQVVAYYLHGDFRCTTCLAIEAMSKDAIENNFEHEISDGLVAWRVINYDLPQNRHYIDEFDIPGSSLVLAREINGRRKAFKIMQKVWYLTNDPLGFENYVRQETMAMLMGEPTQDFDASEAQMELDYE